MGKLVNRAKMTIASATSTVVTLGAAVSGYLTFAAAGVNDADVVSYVIEDGSGWEIGQAQYSAGPTTLTRTNVIASTNGGAALASPSSSAQIYVTPLASDLLQVSVRQTVMSGPTAGGAPSVFPATAPGLSITAQNVSSAVPLIVSAAQGPINVSTALIANPTWSSLAANSTMFHYINAATGATGSTSLAPVYQPGNATAYSTINGQFTFDYQTMIGYMGNGSAAVATPLVFVGQSVTGPSTVTSTAAYAYNGYFESSPTTPLPGTGILVTKNSNMGTASAVTSVDLINITADSGYSPGDVVSPFTSVPSLILPLSPWTNTTQSGFTTGSASGLFILNKSSGASVSLGTSSNWSYRVRTKRVF